MNWIYNVIEYIVVKAILGICYTMERLLSCSLSQWFHTDACLLSPSKSVSNYFTRQTVLPRYLNVYETMSSMLTCKFSSGVCFLLFDLTADVHGARMYNTLIDCLGIRHLLTHYKQRYVCTSNKIIFTSTLVLTLTNQELSS